MIPAVTVYTQPDCVQCDRTKKWLDDPKRGNMAGLYRVVDLAESPEDLAAVKALGYMAAPGGGCQHQRRHPGRDALVRLPAGHAGAVLQGAAGSSMTPDRVRAVQARWPGTRYPYWPAPQ